ncbi:MAG: NAD(P)H-dependent oxidoreductase [Nocardioidaceae bacterium]
MGTLLIVHHSPTQTVRTLTDAVVAGARDDQITDVDVVVRHALEATVDDVVAAHGIILGTPANFGYMSGALKHFFDTIFLEAGGALSDTGAATTSVGGRKPYALYVHGRYDTTGAVRSVLTIVQALPWRPAADVLDVVGDITPGDRAAAYELGGTIAALLSP